MKDEIRDYLLSQCPNEDVGQLTDGQSLLEAGLIDSVAIVDLIVFLEKRYGIAVDADDVTPQNFDSIDSIAEYIGVKRDAG